MIKQLQHTKNSLAKDFFGEALVKAQQEIEEHRATCKACPCDRCDRNYCKRCNETTESGKYCHRCFKKVMTESCIVVTRNTVPERFKWAADLETEELGDRCKKGKPEIDQVLRRITRSDTNLVLLGDTGSGKTSAMVFMLTRWVASEPTVRRGALFVDSSSLARARSVQRLGTGESLDVRLAKDCSLLAIDDLGAEQSDRDNVLTDVVHHRYNTMRPTWFTTGLAANREELADKLTKRFDAGFSRRVLNGEVINVSS